MKVVALSAGRTGSPPAKILPESETFKSEMRGSAGASRSGGTLRREGALQGC
jgi:hypothetical protein